MHDSEQVLYHFLFGQQRLLIGHDDLSAALTGKRGQQVETKANEAIPYGRSKTA